MFEVRAGSSPEDPLIRFRFKNGTDDNFTTYNLLGQSGDVSLSFFKSQLQGATINSTSEWCQICSNTEDRGCAALATAASDALASRHQDLSPAAAGVVGAAVTAVVLLATLGALAFCGFLSFGRRQRHTRSSTTGSAVSNVIS